MSPDYTRALRANLWKLYLIQICRWFLLLMPVLVLFYQENGLDLQDVFIVQAFYSVCIIVFEVPSGYFADRLGRRQSMLIGTVSAAIGFGIYAFSHTLPEILCAQFFIAIGGSFISGSDTALLYDTLIELKQADQYQRIAGRLSSIGNFSEGIAGLLGGLLALLSLRTPLYYQAALMLVAIPLVWSLTEPERHTGERSESTFKAIVAIVRYALHGHAEIKWLILYSSLVGNSTLTIVWLVQPYLQAVDLPLAFFGAAWAALQFSVGLFAINAYRIESLLGRRNALISLILLSSAGYLLLSQFQTLWATAFLFIFYLVRGINGPVLNDYINRCVSSDIRATVLSVKSLVGRAMFALLGPLVGWINDSYSLSAAFMACGVIFLTSGVFFLVCLQRNKLL
jgi:MFS family permease